MFKLAFQLNVVRLLAVRPSVNILASSLESLSQILLNLVQKILMVEGFSNINIKSETLFKRKIIKKNSERMVCVLKNLLLMNRCTRNVNS